MTKTLLLKEGTPSIRRQVAEQRVEHATELLSSTIRGLKGCRFFVAENGTGSHILANQILSELGEEEIFATR
jgi:hypothetical protein